MANDFYEKVGKKHNLEHDISKEQTKTHHTPHTLALKAAKLDKECLKLINKKHDISVKELKINKKESSVKIWNTQRVSILKKL